MAYIVPRVLIKQEFTQVPVFADQPLAALVFGPQYDLYRYSVAGEKTSTKVTHPTTAALENAYQPSSDVVYDFPNQTLGTDVDPDYVKVYFEKAQAEYYPNALASTVGDVSRLLIPNTSNYYPNRVVADTLIFKTANTYDRSTDFSDRDVAAGDVIVLHSDTDDADFTTKVKALHAVKSAAATGTVLPDTDNSSTQAESFNAAPVTGVGNTSTNVVATNASTAFKGAWLSNGTFVKNETFTVTVTTAGDNSTARFAVSSTTGLAGAEDRTDVALAAAPSPLTDADEIALFSDGVSVVKLDFTTGGPTPAYVLGDTWSVTVAAPVVKTYVPTAAGTYTGTVDTTYKLTVVRGGKFYDGSTNAATCARVAITSSGTDSSATVSPQATVAFNVGSYAKTATFAATASAVGGLIEGDEYFIPVTAAADAQVKTIEVYDTLPATLLANTSTDWKITSMRLVKDYQVLQTIPDNDVDLNWEVIDNTITINSGITTTDSEMVDINDVALNLDVKEANIFVEHRDLVKDNTISIGSINDSSLVTETLGTIHPDNPLSQGVYDALLNSAGVTVYYCGVASNDLEGYETVLGLAKKSENYYGLVPLTFDRTIQDAVVAHVNALSTPEVAKWRCAWLSSEIVPTSLVYDLNGEADWVGTMTDDPFTTDAVVPIFTLLTVAGATFITDGVRPGDKVFINFRTDVYGDIVYDTFTVDEVRTETTLVTTSGPTAAINVALKVKIQRVYTKDEQIDNLASVGSDYNNRRVRAVFPSTVKQGTTELPGYFAAAAMAGLRSGVVPHQGLTNTEILGFSDVSDSLSTFTEDQLNRLAEAGYWILTQDVVGATPYVRHQLTTDSENLNASEDSVTTNVDSISYGLRRVLAPYIGKYNVNNTTLVAIKEAINAELNYRATKTFTASAGNQLNGYKIVSLERDPAFKDRINATITLDLPYPLNFITITLVV